MAFLPVTLFVLYLSFSFADQFNCPSLPPLTKPAQNVYELKPQDIKVVMALGDSVTAAFAAEGRQKSIKDFYEFRGQSWSIGGDPDASTIATFLRHYTPNIIGASLGSHFVELCYGIICFPDEYRPSEDVFNAAQSGAMALNLVKHEFKYLYEQLTKNSAVDMKNDWKLMNILIGANDVCLGCSGDIPFTTANDFEKYLREVLEEIKNKIPRVFVNIVELFNISLVYNKSKESIHCTDIHRILPIECICAFAYGKEGDKTRKELDNLIGEYNERIRKLAYEYSQKKYPEFAVVAQPGCRDGRPENVPFDFLSQVDCFHPSITAHQALAKVIWNNMLTPAAQKKTTFDFRDPFVCPTNSTLLYTY